MPFRGGKTDTAARAARQEPAAHRVVYHQAVALEGGGVCDDTAYLPAPRLRGGAAGVSQEHRRAVAREGGGGREDERGTVLCKVAVLVQ